MVFKTKKDECFRVAMGATRGGQLSDEERTMMYVLLLYGKNNK